MFLKPVTFLRHVPNPTGCWPSLVQNSNRTGKLITDSIQVAHLSDGPHDQSGQTVIVDGIRCRFPDGTIAGSSLTLDAAVRNFRAHTGLPLWRVVNMASLYPARSVGVDDRKGSLLPGRDADILIADGDFRLRGIWIRGERLEG